MALNCQSYSCIYNDKEGSCFAQKIDVVGRNAKNSDGTTCSTYVPEGQPARYEIAEEFMNGAKVPLGTASIKCGAMNCVYNADTACTAKAVVIDDADASCETFRK